MRQGLSNPPGSAAAGRCLPPPSLPLQITAHLPYDAVAEEVVIGCAVDTAEGARLTLRRLRPSDFYRPAFAAAIKALPALDHLGDSADRIAAITDRCDLSPLVVSRLIAERPCLLDSAGGYAARVIRAGHRRRVVLAALALAEAAAMAHSEVELQNALADLAAVVSAAASVLAA